MAMDTTGVLVLDSEYENDTLIKVYDYNNKEYTGAEKQDSFILLGETSVKGYYYNIVLERSNVTEIDNVTLEKDTGSYYKVPDIESTKTNVDGVYYSALPDVIEVGTITDSKGNTFEVDEFRLNKILLKEKTETTTNEDGDTIESVIEPVEPLMVDYVKYIPPYTFALLNQNLNKGDFAALTEANGDAICTYPYSCDVAENDVLTVLAGTITQKSIIAKTGDNQDKLPAYFVESIVSVIKSDGTVCKEGTDYILIGSNGIKWLDDDTMPEDGEGYSITYKVYPTYVVLRNIPQLRSSENQRFPKKCIVKYMASYSEQKKVNRQ